MARTGLAPIVATLLWGLACRGEPTAQPRSDLASAAAVERAASDAPEPAPGSAAKLERPPYRPPSQIGEPTAVRRAKLTRTVFAAPTADAAPRGRIPRGQSFRVYEQREAPGCDRPWALVADAAWICLERTERSEEPPSSLPLLEDGAIVPFLYARHEQHEDLSTPALPVYRSLSDYRAGAEPTDSLPAYGAYAFTRLRHNHGDPVLVTTNRDVVPAAGLELLEPSEFSGRELSEAPIPGDRTLAWGVRWRTPIRAAPDPEAEQVDALKFHHTALLLAGDGVEGPEGERWFQIPAGGETRGGFVAADDIRRFVPVAPPAPVLGGQVTIDVDLDQQVLSVWIEDEPVLVTLISSGKQNDATPVGLYRIESKRAHGKMQSQSWAREPYYVDAVPWTMYFQGRYALHTSYWHDMFGHRMSHGCVNLSPRDAKRVFELASPVLPDGWLLVHEHPADPGALVRIRDGDDPTPDLRTPLESTEAG